MEQTDSQPAHSGKGSTFFQRAEEVAGTGNWDFAIEMFLQGILREPENIEQGHQRLREVSLIRKAQGGKGPGMIEQFKRKGGKTPEEQLVNAEYLLAKEPGSVEYMVRFLGGAQKLQLKPVMKWVCDILLEVERQAKRKNMKTLRLLTENYHEMEEYAKALQACEMAVQLAPNDGTLQDALGDLSAKYTIQKGRYDEEGSFVKGVKDMEKQKELFQKDAMVQDREYLEKEALRAVAEHEQDPTVVGKVNAAADALLKLEDEEHEQQAFAILEKAFQALGAYQFKMRMGDITRRKMTHEYKRLLSAGDKTAAAAQAKKILAFELEEYTQRVANYPTELSLKFELGRRQFLSGMLDEAIASFQDAQRDPRKRLASLSYIGQAFTRKGWFNEAADTYGKALEGEMSENRAKEIRYSYADVLEKMGELKRAEEQFSRVAQADFDFKDVRQRIEAVRKMIKEQAAQ
jgi:tetratricopeptide (TPR) repeat protein